jgi:hypothetical protein
MAPLEATLALGINHLQVGVPSDEVLVNPDRTFEVLVSALTCKWRGASEISLAPQR